MATYATRQGERSCHCEEGFQPDEAIPRPARMDRRDCLYVCILDGVRSKSSHSSGFLFGSFSFVDNGGKVNMFRLPFTPGILSTRPCGKIEQEAEKRDCMGLCEARDEDPSRLLFAWFPVKDRTLSREHISHTASWVRGPHNLERSMA